VGDAFLDGPVLDRKKVPRVDVGVVGKAILDVLPASETAHSRSVVVTSAARYFSPWNRWSVFEYTSYGRDRFPPNGCVPTTIAPCE